MDLSKSLKHKLVAALTLPLLDWPILAQAWAWLLIVDLSLRVLPFRRVQRLSTMGTRPIPAAYPTNMATTIDRLQRLVNIAARNHLYDMSCLRQSLVLQRLLAQRDIGTDLRIGVRKDVDDLAAHAWLECAGQPVGEPLDISTQYTPLATCNVNR